MKQKTKKLEKGITLIALVITIIVLLILAGISIAMLTGDNGILNKSTTAKVKTENGTVEEQAKLLLSEYQLYKKTENIAGTSINYLERSATGKEFMKKYEEHTEPETYLVRWEEAIPEGTTGRGKEYKKDQYLVEKVNEKVGNITYEYLLSYYNEKGKQTKLLYINPDGQTPETPKDDKVDYGNKKPGEDTRTVMEQAEAAKPAGSTIDKSTNENTGIVMIDSNGNEWTWIEVPNTVFTTATNSTDYDNIKTDLITYASDYREGKKEQGYNWTDEWYDGCGLTPEEYTNKYQKMLSSVYTNKGFYIGRYEAGIEGSDTDTSLARYKRTEITAESPKAVNKKDMIPYNFVYCSDAQQLANGMSTGNKTSSLMYGIQWDLVCKFLEVKGTPQANIKEDSISWGNYKNNGITLSRGKYNTRPSSSSSIWTSFNTDTKNYVTSSKTNGNASYYQILTTGASEDTNKMNIYDFAGNEYEWTLEKTTLTGSPCSMRGGGYYSDGSIAPVSCRVDEPTTLSDHDVAFRPSLY